MSNPHTQVIKVRGKLSNVSQLGPQEPIASPRFSPCHQCLHFCSLPAPSKTVCVNCQLSVGPLALDWGTLESKVD